MNKTNRAEGMLSITLSAFLFYAAHILNVRWMIFMFFVPFLFLLSNTVTIKRAACYGYCYGLLFFGFVNFWVLNTGAVLYAILVLYQSLFLLVFSAASYIFFKRNKPLSMLFILSSAWVILEFARSRGLLGMPTGFVGYTLAPYLVLVQIASFIGVYGLSFLVIFVNTAIFIFFRKESPLKERCAAIFLVILLFLGLFSYGKNALGAAYDHKDINISIVQGDILQDVKWNMDHLNVSIDAHEFLSKKAAHDDPDLIIWPETAIPCFLLHPEREAVLDNIRAFIGDTKIAHLIGCQDFKSDASGKHAYNTALLFSSAGEAIGRYYKIKLVPFLEYIPADRLKSLAAKFGITKTYDKGKEYTIFSLGNFKFSTVICFEALFPDLVRRFVREGAGFMVNITNDEPSLGRMKLFYNANAETLIIRAIENRRSFVRAANNGLSLVIDPFGRVIGKGKLYVKDTIAANVPILTSETFYTKSGEVFLYICTLIIVLAVLGSAYLRYPSSPTHRSI